VSVTVERPVQTFWLGKPRKERDLFNNHILKVTPHTFYENIKFTSLNALWRDKDNAIEMGKSN
jgi:hypothetical protein